MLTAAGKVQFNERFKACLESGPKPTLVFMGTVGTATDVSVGDAGAVACVRQALQSTMF